MINNGGAVASGHSLVSQAALDIMGFGGNAFDAVIAAGFVSSIAEPALTSLGGGGFLLANTNKNKITLFDFFSNTPGLGLGADQLEPHFFPITVKFSGSEQDFNIGLGSIAVPGNLKGFLHVHKKLGALPLTEIVKPAIKAARHGVIINPQQGYFLGLLYPILTQSAAGRDLYEPKGKYLAAGDRYYNPQLAYFLENIPHGRDADLYTGSHSARIASDMAKGQGLITLEDLANYQVIERRPLAIPYRGRTILTNPPPSFGGSLIAASLRLLDQFDFRDITWQSPEHLATIAAVMAAIEDERDKSPIHSTPPTPQWYADSATTIRRRFSRGTTHISVRDGQGNVASMTTSNGEGSGYLVPDTGIMLNNMMGEDDLHPDGFHASPAGLRVASMMSPTLIMDKMGVELILGSGGSKRIRTAILQVINHCLDFNKSMGEAINAPRLHWDGEVLQIEPGLNTTSINGLEKHWPVNLWPDKNVYFGGVHGLARDTGGGDPRRDGDYREY